MNSGKFTVAITDFWPDHDPARDPIIKQFLACDVEETSNYKRADLVVASLFGMDHLSSRGKVVIFSGETIFRDELADYTIDCRFNAQAEHFRLPLWAYNLLDDESHHLPSPQEHAMKFCNFIYSNPACATRNTFFQLLNGRLPVDSLGSVLKNLDDSRLASRQRDDWRLSKIEVLRDYRFTIAFENAEFPGYTTEKMVDAWLADSVPIYWGNPAFSIEFPPDSCLSLYEAGSLEKLIAQVLEAENEPERYAQLRAANPFRTGHALEVISHYRSGLLNFVRNIVREIQHESQEVISTRRRRQSLKIRRFIRGIH